VSQPRTTVIVVTWRGAGHITRCLAALAAQDRPHRTVVVDNASDDGTLDLVRNHPSRPEVLRLPANRGYAGGLAAALPRATTELVAWLNDDAAPEPGWLAALEDALDADPRAAAASARMISPNGRPDSFGVRLTGLGYGADTAGTDVFGFCGGAALLRVAALRAVGGVPGSFFCYYEDTDTSWRLRLSGWTITAAPHAQVAHVLGASTRPGSARFHRWNERNRLIMLVRCAPAGVAARELARFAVLTAILPVRRKVPEGLNFRLGLRLRVLAEVAVRLGPAVLDRWRIARRSTVGRRDVWRTFAG
jgi:GT2 family glycosyltransferase